MRTSIFTLTAIAVLALGALAVAPSQAQAQLPPYTVGPTITLPPRLPAYYTGPLYWSPVYPWYPWYGYGPIHYPYVHPAYTTYYVPTYGLNRYQAAAYSYWYRNAYAPYVSYYYTTPGYYGY